MQNDLLTWLQEWYFSQCGSEEEWAAEVGLRPDRDLYQWSYGIKIENIDNPGWDVKIDLKTTSLEMKPFEAVSLNLEIPNDDIDWYICRVEDGCFLGTGGPLYLTKIIAIFKKWAME